MGTCAGNEDGSERERGDSAIIPDGRASSWFHDRTEKICSLDAGRADRG
jgi:hypothetical protein